MKNDPGEETSPTLKAAISHSKEYWSKRAEIGNPVAMVHQFSLDWKIEHLAEVSPARFGWLSIITREIVGAERNGGVFECDSAIPWLNSKHDMGPILDWFFDSIRDENGRTWSEFLTAAGEVWFIDKCSDNHGDEVSRTDPAKNQGRSLLKLNDVVQSYWNRDQEQIRDDEIARAARRAEKIVSNTIGHTLNTLFSSGCLLAFEAGPNGWNVIDHKTLSMETAFPWLTLQHVRHAAVEEYRQSSRSMSTMLGIQFDEKIAFLNSATVRVHRDLPRAGTRDPNKELRFIRFIDLPRTLQKIANEKQGGPNTKSERNSYEIATEYFLQRVDGGTPYENRNAAWDDLQKRFKISERKAKKVWDVNAPEEWKKSGPKSKQ